MIRRIQKIVLRSAVAFGVLGAALLLINAWHIGKHEWRPMIMSFDWVTGSSVTGRFVAGRDDYYEIEIELDWTDATREHGRIVTYHVDPTALDVQWSVASDGKIVAEGDSHEALHITEGGQGIKNRIKRRLLANPFHHDSKTGSVSRGVGRFMAVAGRTYDVRVEVGTGVPELQGTNPRAGVRLNREFWSHHSRQTIALASFGLLALLICPAAAGVWIMAMIARPRLLRSSGDSM